MVNKKHWKQLFLFGLGLAAGASFCMKWIESDLRSGGEPYGILGLEYFYSREKLQQVLGGLSDSEAGILMYHLVFDFAFMAGVYPAIAALCMWAREKNHSQAMRKILFALALLQLVAWGGDIIENYYLLGWFKTPITQEAFRYFHVVVAVKWILALTGVLLGTGALLLKRKSPSPV